MTPSNQQPRGPGAPPKDGVAAAGHVHLRVTMERKTRWVRAAQRSGWNLTTWCEKHLDAAAAVESKTPGKTA